MSPPHKVVRTRTQRRGFLFVLASIGLAGIILWFARDRWQEGQWWATALAAGFAVLAYFALRRDFVTRGRAEQALRRAREQLEKRIEERTAELAETNRQLRGNERLLEEMGEIAKVGGWDFDPVTGDGRWTSEVARIHDLDPGERTNRERGLEFYPGESRKRIETAVQAAVEHGTPYDLELDFISAKGVQKSIRTICNPLIEDGKVVKIRGAFMDITDRKQAELKLRSAYDELRQTQQAVMQQERLRALGQMASGIAHDINNAISPVALYTESLLEQEPNLSTRARERLETIRRAIDDVAQTVARMREFYRPREPQLMLSPVVLNTLVKQVIDLTQAHWSDMAQQRGISVEVRTELAADLPAVMGIESEIREALTNLVFNAVDAMPEGGVLTLRTIPAGDKARICVEVADTGIGMDEETRRRCLEPFFTTKGERGTGLGLAMVYGVAQRHSADLEIQSTPGSGTAVRMGFTVQTAPAQSSVEPVEALKLPPLRILVVDDDPLLLQSVSDTLASDGHVITIGEGGQAGIDAFRTACEQNQSFDAVITDLGMPQVDGRKVAGAVKALRPSMPVILLTGWGQRMVSEGDIPPGVDKVLSKPPKIQELRAALALLAVSR